MIISYMPTSFDLKVKVKFFLLALKGARLEGALLLFNTGYYLSGSLSLGMKFLFS